MLNKSASEIMVLGGDRRITLKDSDGLNSYGSIPYPKYTISYSSCTSNNISAPTYSFIESYLNKLRYDNPETISTAYFKNEFEKIRDKLRAFYELDTDTEVVFGASGTDVELIVLALAASAGKNGVHNVILDSNEVGSGIEYVASGKHSSDLTPSGTVVPKGSIIEGFEPNKISTANLTFRNKHGEIKHDEVIVAEIEMEIEQALKQKKRPIVHFVHRSKTGLIFPSVRSARYLIQKYSTRVEWVVDACQGRISIRTLNEYLAFGASVLITGSKFYSGPPFSGALLIPGRNMETVSGKIKLPDGLQLFFSAAEFSTNWDHVLKNLRDSPNLGLLLRWKAAIYEMNRIFLISNRRIEEIIRIMRNSILSAIDRSGVLSNQDFITKDQSIDSISHFSPFEMNTIIPFIVTKENWTDLTYPDAKFIYKALYMDLTNVIEGKKRILEIPVLIGQPVRTHKDSKGSWKACLRLAISTNMISEVAQLDNDLIRMRIESDMNVIIQKVDFILENFETLKFRIQ